MSDAYNREHALGCIINEMLSGDNPQTVVQRWVACSKKGAKKIRFAIRIFKSPMGLQNYTTSST
jgi:hypothetical protein